MDTFDAVVRGAGRVLIRVMRGAGALGGVVALLAVYAPPILQTGLSPGEGVAIGALFGAASGFRVVDGSVGAAQLGAGVVSCVFSALGVGFMLLGDGAVVGTFALASLGAFAVAILVWLALTAARRGRSATGSR